MLYVFLDEIQHVETYGKVRDDGRIRYVQVAVSVADEGKLKQELSVFEFIDDNYPRYILTMDEVYAPDHGGVRTMNVIDFLLGRSEFHEI